ncbi:hypothetical protein PFISCL1PPCAC_17859, partial [Pristionchus fissidentatus]
SKTAFQDWIYTCHGTIWIKFLSFERLDAMLKFAKSIECDQVIFDKIEQHLCECCQFYSDYARNTIISNRYDFKMLRHKVQRFLNRDDEALKWVEKSLLKKVPKEGKII